MITLNIWENGECKKQVAPLSRYGTTVNKLQIIYDEISKPHPHCNFRLSLFRELITQPVLVLLIQLLNQPFSSQSSSTTEPTRDKTTKWEAIEFDECRLALPDSTSLDTLQDGEYCSRDDIQILVSTAALRTKCLSLRLSPEMLHALYDAPKLEISTLKIEKWELSAWDCTRLVNILQRNANPLKLLSLDALFIEDPLVLAESLVNVKELRILCLPFRAVISSSASSNYPSAGDVLVGEGGDSMMRRLLQSPISQVRILHLGRAQLDDRHVMAIGAMLPTSQLEDLQISFNDISLHGILALAQQLPQITCLKTIRIAFDTRDPHGLKGHHQECCTALAQGMRDNYSIESMQVGELSSLPYNDNHFSYYVDLNQAGRRILVTSKHVPSGLWPRMLERVGTMQFRSCTNGTSESQESRRVNAIFFLLQNCKVILLTQF